MAIANVIIYLYSLSLGCGAAADPCPVLDMLKKVLYQCHCELVVGSAALYASFEVVTRSASRMLKSFQKDKVCFLP